MYPEPPTSKPSATDVAWPVDVPLGTTVDHVLTLKTLSTQVRDLVLVKKIDLQPGTALVQRIFNESLKFGCQGFFEDDTLYCKPLITAVEPPPLNIQSVNI